MLPAAVWSWRPGSAWPPARSASPPRACFPWSRLPGLRVRAVGGRHGRGRRPRPRRGGLLAAFPLGVVFGAGWTPCIGPTLATIRTLTTVGQDASPARGAVLAFAYAVGLGVPFLVVAVGLRSSLGALQVLRRRGLLVERVGGAMLLAVGVLLVTGLWDRLIVLLQPLIGGFRTPL